MLTHALKYLSLGLSIIPLEARGKRPLIPWQEFQKRRASEEEVKKWFAITPNANLGIVTGLISGVVVIDLDGQEGLEEAKRLGLTSTTVSLTGDGKHLWFRASVQSPIQNAVRAHPGIDIRGEGGYVVAPPSVHETGRRYRFVTPLLSVGALPLFPSALLVPSALIPSVKVKEEGWNGDSRHAGHESGWIAKALEGMKIGNIDDTLFSICSRLRSDGYSQQDARKLLEPHALGAGATPGHLDEKIRNVWDRYEPRKRVENVLPTRNMYSESSNAGLVIHSPTNPDSLKQYIESRTVDGVSTESGLKTGYSKLDAMLQGGLKSSRLFTVAARTGVGKTNWLIACIRSLCESGKKVLLFSTEMPYAQIWERYIQTLKNADDFRNHSFYICDSFAPNLERVEEAIREIKPDVFMFDHINHVSEEVRGISEFMQGLNFLRRKYDVAGIVTAQLNRQADWVDLKSGEKVTPRMSMIKGSGTIEQASSRVLLLSETRVTPESTEIVGNLDKNDNGPKGLIHFCLKSNPYRMEEI